VRLRATIKIFSLSIVFITAVTESAFANPYLAKVGERSTSIRIATCAVSGGFVHLYAAIENNLFEKYGFKLEHIYIRGTGPSLAALMADEIQFLYCAADATIPSLATGVDASLWRRPWSKCLSYWLHKKRFEN
jgi:ABC-type nitrate/sulfonate/bicarbonate transport system substrate-binding protein